MKQNSEKYEAYEEKGTLRKKKSSNGTESGTKVESTYRYVKKILNFRILNDRGVTIFYLSKFLTQNCQKFTLLSPLLELPWIINLNIISILGSIQIGKNTIFVSSKV